MRHIPESSNAIISEITTEDRLIKNKGIFGIAGEIEMDAGSSNDNHSR